MILLDMKTIIFSYVLTDIVCLAVIVILWRQSRKRFAGTGFFIFDFALQTAALLLIISRGNIPDWMSMVLANTMVITGALLGYMGLERFLNKKSSQIHNYILLAAFALIHAYFTFVQSDQAIRSLNLAVGLLIICLQCAWLLLRKVESGMRPLTRGVGIVFGIYCLVSIIRIVNFIIFPHADSDYLQAGTFEQLVLISHQMLFILLTYSLVLMFNKRLFVEIQTEENKFSKAFHSSPYAATITRLSDGQIIEVNESFFRITGYQPDEIRGKTTPVLHLWDRDEDRAFVISELASKGKMQMREFRFRKKSGEIITGLFSAEIININNEICVLSSINDITGRKQAEEVSIQEQALSNAIIDAIPGTFYMLDEIGQYVRWNAYQRDEIVGKPDDMVGSTNALDTIHPDDRELIQSKIVNILANDVDDKIEGRVLLRGGPAFRWLLMTGRRMLINDHPFLVGIGIDITERKQAESQREAFLKEIEGLNAELENKVTLRTGDLRNSQLALLSIVEDLNSSNKQVAAANQSLDATNKELEAFSYSVSHDLRAPLRSIDGFSQALLEDYQNKIDDTGRNYLNKVRAAAQHMGLLIDDMLKLSRITHAKFHHESIDLSKIARSIAETLQKDNPDQDIKITIQEGIVINGDLSAMRIALTNLLGNAWKFTGKTENAHIEFGTLLKDGKPVMFIRDNGAGFDMSYVDKLFGAFQRLHTKDEFTGTGIGLATVKRIITRHGGQIWAEGEVGKGAVFYFTLPE